MAIYVDGTSIHLGEVLCRDRRIEQRLREMSPPWSVLRFRRREIDGSPEETIKKLRAALK